MKPFGGQSTIPKGWRQVRLGDVCEFIRDGDWIESKDQGGNDYRLLQLSNIGVGEFIETGNFRWVTQGTFERLNCTEVMLGDVLTARMPDPIGRTWYVSDLSSPAITAVDLAIIRTFHDVLSPKFLSYFLNSSRCLRFLGSFATGTTRKRIRRTDIALLPILLPPLPEQRAIAAVLDSIDEAIESAEAVIAATEQLRDSLLHQLLTCGVPGWHTEWKEAPGLGTIPAGWEVVRLGEVTTVERGKFAHRPRNEPRFYGGDIPFIQTGDVVKATGQILEHSQTLNELGLSISRLFPAGTIIITIAANIGETAIASYPVAFPDSLVGITPGAVDASFLEYFLRTRKAYLNELAPESAQKNINLEDLRPLLTPLPSPNEQQAIAATLNGVGAAVDVAQGELLGLRLLKESTANDLLTGRVRVGQENSAHGR